MMDSRKLGLPALSPGDASPEQPFPFYYLQRGQPGAICQPSEGDQAGIGRGRNMGLADGRKGMSLWDFCGYLVVVEMVLLQ